MGTGSDKVPSLAFHPDSKHVAAGLLGNARMYDVSTSRLVANVEVRPAVAGGANQRGGWGAEEGSTFKVRARAAASKQ